MTHSVHPAMAAILREQQAAAPVDFEALPIAEARAQFVRNTAAWNLPLPHAAAHDVAVGGVPCRWLTPADPLPGLVLFVHGGGWTFGSPATHDRFVRLLAEQARAAVVVPDYRLAPEHPCPAAIDDVLAVLAALPRGDGPVVLCGDSAGATIALAAALERPGAALAGLSLLYGCYAPDFATASHGRNGDGRFGLSTARMRWYWANWLGAAADRRAAPLGADLAGLPPVHLVAAALDPLCDDTVALAGRLAAHGVATRLDAVPGVVHGFLQMTARLPPAAEATRTIAAQIRTALDNWRDTP